jgi:metal-responsive CopG/Arc/MetJ family transcriptional regulator
MFSAKIKLDKELLERAREYAKRKGYSSVEEFITHILESEMAVTEEISSDEEVKKKLQGLGYID